MASPEKKWRDYTLADDYYKNMLPYAQEVYNVILKYYQENISDDRIPFAIDCACGNGQISERLAKDCDEVLGFDISSNQVEVGIRNSSHKNVSYKVSSVYDMSKLLPDDHARANLMTCNASSHYFNNASFYTEVRRCLKMGGVLAESIGNFEKFVECGDEMYEENLNFAKWLITDGQVNDAYNDMYKITATGYKTLNVLLENVCRVESYVDIPVTISDAIRYFLCRQPNAKALWDEARAYYERLWDRFSPDSNLLTARFNIFVVFSQNMQM